MRSSARPHGKASAARLFKSGSQPLYFRALLCALLGCAALYLGAGAGAHNGDFTSGESYTVNKADQTITFGALSSKTFGDADFGVTASATSGLAVSFSASGNCTVTGSTVHITGAGSCTITASQPGDANFNAATPVDQTFNVAKAASTIDVGSFADPAIPGQSVTFHASVATRVAMPTGTVQFKVDGNNLGGALNCVAQSGDICTAQVSTTSLTLGTHTLAADYSGDSNFNPSSGSFIGGQTIAASVIEFAQPTYTVSERAGSILITIRRTGDASGAASVNYQTQNRSTRSFFVPCSSPVGFASERCDFARAEGTLQFAPGETLKGFTVLVNDDSYNEGTEMVFLRLSKAVGSALTGQVDNNLEITDDVPESAGNPIDDDQDFVRQHYHDFLNREPDDAGLKFWTDGLKACGADAQCREVKRVNTSAAFFLSIEFQDTGFFVYRVHKAAFGQLPPEPPAFFIVNAPVRLGDFLLDTQRIGQGVVVGQGNWQNLLEANKQAFAPAFVQRADFLARYPASTSAADFVGALNANAGGALSDNDRAALIAELSPNPSDAALRADVLRKIAENDRFKAAELNRAFVLMEYFGYLRRDPDSAPDANFSGYDFWLQKLNQFNGNFVQAEMVKAFITSAEYRNRFGQ
jgi:hypothetical protein